MASICHGPWIFISAKIVKGKKMTSTPALTDDLLNAGAKWVNEEVTVDGRMVTSRKPDDLPAFMRETLKLLAQ
jgi:protease I